jgi:hypothetical protein
VKFRRVNQGSIAMQTFREFATKNGVTLAATGPCQFCGAEVERGVEQCLDLFSGLAGLLRYEKEYAAAHLLSVDSHTLQHPEIHGRLNNHVHLLSLCLMLERGASSAMGTRKPAVEKFLALGRQWPPLAPPPIGQRGGITVAEVVAASVAQRPEIARHWAEQVWRSWQAHQPWARRTLDRLTHE